MNGPDDNTPGTRTRGIEDVWAGVSVVPVLTLADPSQAVPLARALARGGLPVVEITLRTGASLDALEAVAAAGFVAGAGTVTRPEQVALAAAAGARFIVAPGFSRAVAEAAAEAGLPYLPGVATATEIMRAVEAGFDRLKLFPAAQLGGVAAVKALAAPFPQVRFCPTGGIDATSCRDYLALPAVFAVGGSWVAPDAAIATGDWARIESLARTASGALPNREEPPISRAP